MAEEKKNNINSLIKILLVALVPVFLAMFGFLVSEIREIRINSQKYYEKLYKQDKQLGELELRVKLLGLIPPSDSPSLSVEDMAKVVEMLKNRK